jgi:hypothetical protein
LTRYGVPAGLAEGRPASLFSPPASGKAINALGSGQRHDGGVLPLAKTPRSQRSEGLLSPVPCSRPSVLPWRSLRLGERIHLGCGRRPGWSVRIFSHGMLVFMQHTDVTERLCMGERVSSLKRQVSSKMTMRNEPNLAGPGTRRASRARRPCYEDASRFTLHASRVLSRNEPNPGPVSSLKCQVSSKMNAQNEPNSGSGKAGDKCFMAMDLCCIWRGRGNAKTKPIARRFLRVLRRIGFVSHNRTCRLQPRYCEPGFAFDGHRRRSLQWPRPRSGVPGTGE